MDIATTLGLGSEVKFRDKVYRVRPWTQETKGRFELWLRRRVEEEFEADKQFLSADEIRERRAQLQKDKAAGKYRFGSETARDALFSFDGLVHVMYLLMRDVPENQPLTEELVGEMVADDLEKIMATLGEANADPTTPAPATAGQPATR